VVLLLNINILLLSEQAVSLIHATLAPLFFIINNVRYLRSIKLPDVVIPLRLLLFLLLLSELLEVLLHYLHLFLLLLFLEVILDECIYNDRFISVLFRL